jgi:5'-deoxynucleotidase YfbR-like HD superfamily hydrolase
VSFGVPAPGASGDALPQAGEGSATLAARESARLSPALLQPFREVDDLKRITSAGREGSIATRLFLRAWGALAAGADESDVAWSTLAAGLAAARLGDLDRATLTALGLDAAETLAVLNRAVDEIAAPFDSGMIARAREAVGLQLRDALPPAFAQALARQPRAGVTCPGRPRAMLLPPENHADHSLAVALYAMLLAPTYRADPVRVFTAALQHHLHSAAMPDSGFTGEVLLGDALPRVVATARAQSAAELPGVLRERCEALQAEIASDATPLARAFHAADAIDRVLEIESHLKRGTLTMGAVLRDYGLVHDGPVKAFQDRVLAEVGLC